MPDANETAELLRTAVSRLATRLRAAGATGEDGLTRLAVSVLANLRHSGPLQVGTLAAIEGLQPQSITRTVRSLESAGHLRREPDASDGRAQRLSITEDGRTALREHVRDGNRWLAEALAAELTEAEQELLRIAAALLLQVADRSPAAGRPGLGAAPPL